MTDAALYETLRPSLLRHAYHMLGTQTDAEDVVQDAFIRWESVERAKVREPQAYLRATVTRLAIDRLRAAKRARETYVGPWLPEPIVSDETSVPEHVVPIAEDVSYAFLLALERLSPLERAAFLLHDALDVPFAEIASILERSEESVRRLASRAREHIRSDEQRRIAKPKEARALRERFVKALNRADVTDIMEMLTEDAVLTSDGGGKRLAAINPIFGRDKIARFFAGVVKKSAGIIVKAVPATVNDLPGYVLFSAEGVDQTMALEYDGDRICALYVVRNPDKLTHVAV